MRTLHLFQVMFFACLAIDNCCAHGPDAKRFVDLSDESCVPCGQ